MPGESTLRNSIRPEMFGEFSRLAFSSLPRADQKRWAEVYLRGLLSVDGKKTIRKMVGSRPRGSQLGAIQSLQQFIGQSPWDWNPVRESLARIVCDQGTPRAWIVNRVTIPKRGVHSVGVARRSVEPGGRMMNCQVGFGIFLATEYGSLPVDWCLKLDDEWINERKRRERTRVPESVRRQSSADQVLEMVDRLRCDWRVPRAPIVSSMLNSHLDARKLITGLVERKHDFLIKVPASSVNLEPLRGSVRTTMTQVHAGVPHGGHAVRVRGAVPGGKLQQAGGTMSRGLRSSSVRILGSYEGGGSAPTFQSFTAGTPAERSPNYFWVTNVSDRHRAEFLGLSLLHQQSAADVREMQESFGLRDFEGRSYPGWHHHMTLVSAAFNYHRLAAGHAGTITLDRGSGGLCAGNDVRPRATLVHTP